MQGKGEILDFRFEPFRFILAPKTTYLPDFLVVTHKWLEIHEVKGFWRDDARVKIKTAAALFPWFRFLAVTLDNKLGWQFERFN